MAEDKNYTNNKERPREDEELEIDLMEYVRKLWAARKVLLKAAGIGAIVGVIIALSIPKQYTVEVTLSPESGKSGGGGPVGTAGYSRRQRGGGEPVGNGCHAGDRRHESGQ